MSYCRINVKWHSIGDFLFTSWHVYPCPIIIHKLTLSSTLNMSQYLIITNWILKIGRIQQQIPFQTLKKTTFQWCERWWEINSGVTEFQIIFHSLILVSKKLNTRFSHQSTPWAHKCAIPDPEVGIGICERNNLAIIIKFYGHPSAPWAINYFFAFFIFCRLRSSTVKRYLYLYFSGFTDLTYTVYCRQSTTVGFR